ncbi:MAG: cation-translocating P-type ATPase [Anaerolineae bacterium]|nr:cation-translocating P-type ATPase [Anaerolineae bacterium]
MPDTSSNQPTWYTMPAEAVGQQLKVDPAKGLSSAEAAQRLQQYGPNQLAGKKKEPGWLSFLRQYKDFMQIILIGAAVINLIFTQDLRTSVMLVLLTVFNAVMSLRQESKAEASLAALEKMMKNIARVRRDGQAVEIEAEQIVPGDIVLMEAGNRVPADGRLFVTATLEIEEAALTGESVASPKDTETIEKADAPLGDRHCMAYMNTAVTRGRGEMIVTTTGMGTEMGKIADLLNKTEADKTPLQKQLDRLTIIIAGLAGIAFLGMLALGLARGQSFDAIFVAGIALAISAIPTGLPAVVTTLYSMGTQVLASQNAIVKRLPSVETLGSVSAICSDKTGTLTLNKMTAREFTIPGVNRYKVTGEGYSTKGELLHSGGAKIDLDEILLPMALCADARLDGDGGPQTGLIGDPTEGALIVLAEKGGISIEGARQMYPRIAEVPFDSDYKFMATFHNMTNHEGKPVVRCFVKGAPDVLIARSAAVWQPGGAVVVPPEDRTQLAFDPKGPAGDGKLLDLVKDLTFLAMVGIVDPPRAEAKAAIAKCHSAGIQVRMITGDHAVTAAAIGHELGIEGKALTGAQFAAMSDDDLKKDLDNIGVIARVAPEDKIRLVRLLQEKQNIVAMTGDGVNDAPALKKADIGVAMGITGTEVSKGAAVMILTDDNFATIVKAVEFGRAIYDNLAKYIRFQMTALVAFIASYLGAALFLIAGGVPFSPQVVLWINFLVQVPIAIALGFDKPSPGLMERKPRPLSQPVMNRAQWTRAVVIGVLMTVGTLALEALYTPGGDPLMFTMGFAVFSLFNIVMGLAVRSETDSVFNRDIISDRRQLMLYGLALLLTLLPTELEFIRSRFGLTSLTMQQWLICAGLAFALLLVTEVMKVFIRRSRRHEAAAAEPVAVSGPAPA